MAKRNKSPLETLTASVVAKLVNRSPRTVSHWFSTGVLGSTYVKSQKGRAIRKTWFVELRRFCRVRGMKMDKSFDRDSLKGASFDA